jgi:toxin ParE1/3/4
MAPSTQILIRPAARRDLIESYDYLNDDAGVSTADRFLDGIESAAHLLIRRPKVGRTCGFTGRISSRIRQWPVPDFEDWLIFYIPYKNRVEFLRVLHGARDLATILE